MQKSDYFEENKKIYLGNKKIYLGNKKITTFAVSLFNI